MTALCVGKPIRAALYFVTTCHTAGCCEKSPSVFDGHLLLLSISSPCSLLALPWRDSGSPAPIEVVSWCSPLTEFGMDVTPALSKGPYGVVSGFWVSFPSFMDLVKSAFDIHDDFIEFLQVLLTVFMHSSGHPVLVP